MDLKCAEMVTEKKLDMNCAEVDQTMINDPRIILNLLVSESKTTVQCNYFLKIQHEILPFMRGVVASWMMEVGSLYNFVEKYLHCVNKLIL